MNTNLSSLSVLIVDDDDYQRNLLKKMLVMIGVAEINQSESALLALQFVSTVEKQPDIIISDLDMPGTDGMEFLHQLCDNKIGAAVLIVSGKDNSILRSVELMAEEYGLTVLGALAKPAKLPELRQKLSGALQQNKPNSRRIAKSLSKIEIQKGIKYGQFEPFFQPQVELVSRHVCGVEALARWRHPELGIVPPGMFIGVAEQNGLIDQLTWVILEKAIAQAGYWNNAGLNITVSINFSQTTLSDTRLPNRIMDVLSRHGVAPEQLIVEITESVAMTDVARCLETLSRLRIKGFGVSIDDFGTGFASLQQLSRVPYTELKIDQIFVTGASKQPHLLAAVESSADMARKLGLRCIGEGIEAFDDWNCLRQLGCDIGQGYYIAKPMEGAKFIEWLQVWNSKTKYVAERCLNNRTNSRQMMKNS